MQKAIGALILLLVLFLSGTVMAYGAAEVTINELIENAKELDGREVTIQGEVIGEAMEREDYCWININDTTNAIGIWLKKEEADKITRYGSYKNIGDTVQVTGVFNRACREHGGEADLHGEEIRILEKGHPALETLSKSRIIAGGILTLIVLAVFVCFCLNSSKTGFIISLKKSSRTHHGKGD